MRIVYIAPQPIPSRAANSVHVMKMMQAFGRLGHDATLLFQKSGGNTVDICSFYGVDPVFKLVPRINFPGAFGTVLYPLQNIIGVFLRKPDLVLSRNLLTAWLTALAGFKTIFEIHDSPDALRPLALKVFRSFIRKENSKIIAISQALSEHLQHDHAIPASKIILAPDAADPFLPLQAPVFKKPDGSFHVGYTGHLYKGRGIDMIGEMTASLPDMHFHIVGGADEDIAYWKEKLTGLDNIKFYGHVPHAKIGDYLQSFDALLAPYQKDVAVKGNKGNTGRWMSPLKIFEYMAAGKPILCSDLPVLREILNPENSILCQHDNVKIWIESLKYLKLNPEKAEAIGHNAQTEFLINYTWQERARKIAGSIS